MGLSVRTRGSQCSGTEDPPNTCEPRFMSETSFLSCERPSKPASLNNLGVTRWLTGVGFLGEVGRRGWVLITGTLTNGLVICRLHCRPRADGGTQAVRGAPSSPVFTKGP